MTTREQNDFLSRSGPGTPMGHLIRRYWIPALLSSEIAEPDCPPVRVKILSERLLAFAPGHLELRVRALDVEIVLHGNLVRDLSLPNKFEVGVGRGR